MRHLSLSATVPSERSSPTWKDCPATHMPVLTRHTQGGGINNPWNSSSSTERRGDSAASVPSQDCEITLRSPRKSRGANGAQM